MIELFNFQLTYQELSFLFIAAIIVGMAKTGISVALLIAVAMLAYIFGGKTASGLMLPMLIIADVFAVLYYHRHASWHHLKRIFPTAAIGVVLGTLIGGQIDDVQFKQFMGIIILVSLGVMFWLESKKEDVIPNNPWFAMTIGLFGGVTTMVGNLAGAIMTLYLLSTRLPKNAFIGTAAWFFLLINLYKVPFHVFVWKTISLDLVFLNLITLPFIGLGIIIGIQIVKRIPEKQFRIVILIMTAISAFLMFL